MTGGGGGGSLAGLWYFLLILFVAIVTRSTAGKDPDDNGEFAVPDPPLVEQYGDFSKWGEAMEEWLGRFNHDLEKVNHAEADAAWNASIRTHLSSNNMETFRSGER